MEDPGRPAGSDLAAGAGDAALESANGLRTERLKEELAAMGETAPEPVPDYLELIVTVGTDSTIRLRKTERNLLLAGSVIGGTGNGERGGLISPSGWCEGGGTSDMATLATVFLRASCVSLFS